MSKTISDLEKGALILKEQISSVEENTMGRQAALETSQSESDKVNNQVRVADEQTL